MAQKKHSLLDKFSYSAIHWLGSTASLIFHTILFILFMLSIFVGVSLDTMLLVLTTVVSLEAIYLAIFIQMAVNKQEKRLRGVEEDVEDILEDTEDLTEEG